MMVKSDDADTSLASAERPRVCAGQWGDWAELEEDGQQWQGDARAVRMDHHRLMTNVMKRPRMKTTIVARLNTAPARGQVVGW